MKATVAKVLLGSMFYCLLSNFSVSADSSTRKQKPKVLSARVFTYDDLRLLAPDYQFKTQDLIYTLNPDNKDYVKNIVKLDSWHLNKNINELNLLTNQFLPKGKRSQIHRGQEGDMILGFHKTFWDSDSKQRYWGLTTIEQWGDRKIDGLKLDKLDYKNSAPILPKGTTTLTVSGGGKGNLLSKKDVLGEFEDFRGGLAYHEGLDDNFTLGLGFFYEDFLSSFSQITYQPTNFPLRTTISFLTSEDGIDINSHLQLKPSQDFVLNFYSNSEAQKFDLNWGVASGITLTAAGDNQKETLKAGAKIAFKNEFLSFLAQAQLDNNNDLQWKVSSKLGRLQLIHASNKLKTNSKIQYDLADYSSNFQFAMFFKHQTQEIRKKQEELGIIGWNFNSGEKIANNRYDWQLSLGYGFGSQGQGAIVLATKTINPKLFFKFTYENISLRSDDTKIKFELTSK